MSKRVRVYGFLAIVALIAGGYYLNKRYNLVGGVANAKTESAPGKGQEKDPNKDVTPVELAAATKGNISAFITSTGNLRALREVAIATQIEGIVKKVLAEEGDFVKEGQVLCLFDDTQLRIQLELAQEKLAQAKLQFEKARIRQEKAVAQIGHNSAELERYRKAHAAGLVSEKEVAGYRYKVEELEHDLRVSSSESKEFDHRVSELEAEIAQAKLQISRTEIKAPFGGFITDRTVVLGQRVRALDPLFNLGEFTPLYTDVFLSEREASQVKASQGATVRLGVDDTARLQGRVERISPIVDQATGTVKVTIELRPSIAGFKPGAFVRVEIRTDTRQDAVLIPKRAVLEEDGENFVYIANGETVNRKKIVVGYENEGSVEVRNGVHPGEKVVVAGQGALKEGARIKVTAS